MYASQYSLGLLSWEKLFRSSSQRTLHTSVSHTIKTQKKQTRMTGAFEDYGVTVSSPSPPPCKRGNCMPFCMINVLETACYFIKAPRNSKLLYVTNVPETRNKQGTYSKGNGHRRFCGLPRTVHRVFISVMGTLPKLVKNADKRGGGRGGGWMRGGVGGHNKGDCRVEYIIFLFKIHTGWWYLLGGGGG